MTSAHKPIIGIVGGIGSGKTAAARYLAEPDGQLILADALGHEALRQPMLRDRVRALWPHVIAADGEVDRRLLGAIVFADPSQLVLLEGISFPWIGERIRNSLAEAQLNPRVAYVVLDAAILYETGWNSVCDAVVYIHTPRDLRIARVAERGWSAQDLGKRERQQWPLARKALAADWIVTNAHTLDRLHAALNRLRPELTRPSGRFPDAIPS